MKRTAVLLLFLFSIVAANAEELLTFSLTSYSGWIYTRSDTPLSGQTIGADQINLYGDFTLISPLVQATGINSIVVKVKGRSLRAEDPSYSYNPTIGSPTVELLDENNSVIKSMKYNFTTNEFDRNFEVTFDISDIASRKFKLRLACWDADLVSAMAVRRVIVEDCLLAGDINGDGSVTAADVTALYDYLLNNDTSQIVNGDVDGNGDITSADVTAVYNVLLGVQ